MRPTRRALGVVGLCVVGLALAVRFGARAIGALLVPMVVALVAGALQVWLTDRPSIRRSQPESGFPGEARVVELAVEAENDVRARVTDTIGDGLLGATPRADVSLPATVAYEIELGERGEARLGPASVRVTDVFGLFTREYEYGLMTSVLVYPAVKPLSRPVREVAGVEAAASDERRAFDRLREYVPGDSPRDIHWKSSAKRDEFVVMEFAADDPDEVIAVAAEATSGHADAMATATASIVLEAIDAGLAVSLSVPRTHSQPVGGPAGRDELLTALARTTGGPIDDERRAGADVVVVADREGTRVHADGHATPFDRLVGDAAGTGHAPHQRAKARDSPAGHAPAGRGRIDERRRGRADSKAIDRDTVEVQT